MTSPFRPARGHDARAHRAAPSSSRSARHRTTGRRSSSAAGSRRRMARRSACSASHAMISRASGMRPAAGRRLAHRPAPRRPRARACAREARPTGSSRQRRTEESCSPACPSGGGEGLGPTRLAVAERAPVPVLFVRRGVSPGALAPPDQLTRFAWSLAGAVREPVAMAGRSARARRSRATESRRWSAEAGWGSSFGRPILRSIDRWR